MYTFEGTSDISNASENKILLEVLFEILGELKKRGVSHALLHGRHLKSQEKISDIDLVFHDDPQKVLEPVLRYFQAKEQFLIVQRLHYDVPKCFYYILAIKAPSGIVYLDLDCMHDNRGINKYKLKSKELLSKKVQIDGVYCINELHETLYLLIKKTLKNTFKTADIAKIRKRLTLSPLEFRQILQRYLGARKTDRIIECVEKQTELASTRKELYKYLFGGINRLSFFRAYHHFFRIMGRFIKPSGFFVSFMGPDGSGKSTIVNLTLPQIENAYRKTFRFHWRPGFFRKLVKRKTTSTDVTPDIESRYGYLMSLARFSYYYLDFLIGGFIKVILGKSRTTIVLGERYYMDMLVHPGRYGFKLPKFIFKLGYFFVAKPDMLVLLTNDADTILSRKSELTKEVLTRQLKDYESIAKSTNNALVVKTDRSPNEISLSLAWKILLRTSQRNGLHPDSRPESKEAFTVLPNVSRPRYVLPGNYFRNHIGILSTISLSRIIYKRLIPLVRPFLYSGKKHSLDNVEESVRHNIAIYEAELKSQYQSISIAYYVGTKGPEQKYVASISDSYNIIAYCKIASNAKTEKLLHNEEVILQFLDSQDITKFSYPALMSGTQINGFKALSLSPLYVHKKKRMRDLPDRIFSFSIQLWALRSATASLSNIASDNSSIINSRVLANIEKKLTDSEFITSFAHGDLVPWNILSNNNDLAVLDWEHAGFDYPVFYDLFHYLVIQRILLSKDSSLDILNLVLNRYARSLQSVFEKAGLGRNDIETYFALFLVFFVQRRLDTADDRSANRVKSLVTEMLDFLQCKWKAADGDGKNVLVSAYACEPGKGSEPAVGWNMVNEVAKSNFAWVITKKNNQIPIQNSRLEHELEHVFFSYLEIPKWLSFWKKGHRFVRTYYYLWQFAALLRTRKLAKLVDIDCGHHVTFVCDWMFSFFSLTKIPFVWGPIGSHPKIPRVLASSKSEFIKDKLRTGFQTVVRNLDPLFWLTVIKADLIVCINENVANSYPIRIKRADAKLIHTAIGIESSLFEVVLNKTRKTQAPFVVMTMGKLVPIKGMHLVISSFADFAKQNNKAILRIIGTGKLKKQFIHMVAKLDLNKQVEFIDWLERADALKAFADANLFLYPSFESGGIVALEAMALGVPIVSLDYAGPGSMVKEVGGDLVALGSKKEVIRALSHKMVAIEYDYAASLDLAEEIRLSAKKKYCWENRHIEIAVWYNKILEKRAKHVR